MTEQVHLLTIVDGESEELVGLIELKSFSLAEFQRQFDVDSIADPSMLDRYSVGPDDIAFLKKHLARHLEFDFQRFAYFIEAAKKN